MKKDADIPAKIKSTPEFAVASNFIAGGIANIIEVWFRGEMKQSLNELVLSVAHLITVPLPASSSMVSSMAELPIPAEQDEVR